MNGDSLECPILEICGRDNGADGTKVGVGDKRGFKVSAPRKTNGSYRGPTH